MWFVWGVRTPRTCWWTGSTSQDVEVGGPVVGSREECRERETGLKGYSGRTHVDELEIQVCHHHGLRRVETLVTGRS